MPTRGPRWAAVAVAALAVSLSSCSSGGSGSPGTSSASTDASTVPTAVSPPSATPRSTGASTSTATAKPSSPAAEHTAAAVFAAMSERQRVGQLLMVDCPSSGVAAATVSAITDYDVGSVILDGTTRSGSAAIRSITGRLQGYSAKVGLFIATDQEGGLVQRLQGSGFDTIPGAPQQGLTSPTALRTAAHRWGSELKRAGVNVDLAPVLDTVPSGAAGNPPIGDLDREYGHTPAAVQSHGLAYAQGMIDAGVAPTAKHFPGLGRVAGNTDVTAGVTDPVTTRTDAYLAPFQAAVRARVPFVMMSTAIYSRIDPGTPAAFSRTIVTGMLRNDLGYRGLIISDDVGAARQVSGLSPGQRAVEFVQAGGDVVLTVVAGQARAMTSALLAKVNSDSSFRKTVDTAALLVLQAKQRAGLL
jgi:beta-N-acetylhexosaminidase